MSLNILLCDFLWLHVIILDSSLKIWSSSFFYCLEYLDFSQSFLVAHTVKNLPTVQEMQFDPWVRKITWRREWQSTPVILPGEFRGQRSLAGYSPWGHKQSDMTESHTHTHTHTHTHNEMLFSLKEKAVCMNDACMNLEDMNLSGINQTQGKMLYDLTMWNLKTVNT